MNAPGDTPPQPPARRPAGGAGIVLALCALMLIVLVLGAACSFYYLATYLAIPWLRAQVPAGLSPDAWQETSELSQIYTTALDEVVAHPEVGECLGEPIAADLNAKELYRHRQTLTSPEETIEFDVVGTRQRGIASVVIRRGHGTPGIVQVNVTADDGSVIEVLSTVVQQEP